MGTSYILQAASYMVFPWSTLPPPLPPHSRCFHPHPHFVLNTGVQNSYASDNPFSFIPLASTPFYFLFYFIIFLFFNIFIGVSPPF